MKWDEYQQLIYTAALLEGEGTFYKRVRGNHPVLVIKCAMTDKEPLERLFRYNGGYIIGPRPNGIGCKEIYIWGLERRQAVVNLLIRLRGMMSPRRKVQIDGLLELHKEYPFKLYRERGQREHGTLTMYVNVGCRCSSCKAANAAYSRMYKARKVQEASNAIP